jgi:hypothetical protein
VSAGRLLGGLLVVAAAAALLLDLAVERDAPQEAERLPGYLAALGVLAGFAAVFLALGVRILVGRPAPGPEEGARRPDDA